jgi:hypothetical protein
MKNFFIVVASIFFIGCGWLFFEYLNIASSAEQQVVEDIQWLHQGFNDPTKFLKPKHFNKKLLETKLIQQSVDFENRFIRHYRSLFVKDGNRSCLESLVRYEAYQPIIEKETWLAEVERCIN